MSLRHAMLALLTAKPMTGYEVAKTFEDSVGMLWAASHSQIYPELRKMAEQGLVVTELIARGRRAEKRLYSITDAGREELSRWMAEVLPYPAERDPHRLKSAYFELCSTQDVRAQLRAHLAHHTARLALMEHRLDSIRSLEFPLLCARLQRWPAHLHKSIVAFKAFAFEGHIARLRAEIEWADKGLKLLEELETATDSHNSTERALDTAPSSPR